MSTAEAVLIELGHLNPDLAGDFVWDVVLAGVSPEEVPGPQEVFFAAAFFDGFAKAITVFNG